MSSGANRKCRSIFPAKKFDAFDRLGEDKNTTAASDSYEKEKPAGERMLLSVEFPEWSWLGRVPILHQFPSFFVMGAGDLKLA